MSTNIEQLIAVLERSESICLQLLPVFQKEKKATLSSDPEQLSSAVADKEALLAQMRTLERQRQLLINKISTTWNVPVKEMRLSGLADRTQGTQAARLRRLHISLKELVQNIKRANEENRILIQHCLSIVHGAFGFLQHWMMPTDVYGSSGQVSHQHSSGNLVSGAI
ncbi:MAG: flagellar protein FlgN [Desulfobacteraceae bacterium]|jgi:flagellar biosynthesis/type III secretory pathway chaperone